MHIYADGLIFQLAIHLTFISYQLKIKFILPIFRV